MFNNHNPRSSKTQKPQIYQGSQYGSRFLNRSFLNLQSKRQRRPCREIDNAAVQNRQSSGQPKTDRACVGIWLAAGLHSATAEYLRRRRELCMDFHADYRFPTVFYHI